MPLPNNHRWLCSVAHQAATRKGLLRNVLETKEFVVNIVSAALGDAMNISSGSFPYGTNEFTKAGLAMADGETVSVPRVKAAPAALECHLWQAIDLPAQKMGRVDHCAWHRDRYSYCR